MILNPGAWDYLWNIDWLIDWFTYFLSYLLEVIIGYTGWKKQQKKTDRLHNL